MFRDAGQRQLDADRTYYELTFPADMSDKQIHAFIRSIGKNLQGGSTWSGVPTMVFELWASPHGIKHRLRVPSDAATYLIGQLQSALPGIDVTEVNLEQNICSDISTSENERLHNSAIDDLGFQFGATLHMANSGEELPIVNAMDYSHRILASMQDAVNASDTICVQWVIAHSNNQKQPPSDRPVKTQRSSGLWKLVVGEARAGRDEVTSRRQKQVDQVYVAIGRVAARGKTDKRAAQLVRQVVRAYTSEGGFAHFWAKGAKPQEISDDIRLGKTPFALTAQLSVKELASVIGWPMSDAYVPGLERGATRHLPAPESVPRSGRVLGQTTMPGIERQIAMSYGSAVSHMYIAGGTGVGKTTLMVNTIRQDMDAGAGIILIERDGNLFRQALDQVPPSRLRDVICVDLSRWDRPVGLNLLRLNQPEIVAGQLATLLDALYPDAKSIYANQLVRQGIPVLANLERATVADLLPLVHPRNPVEKAWARAAVEKMPDKAYRDFWADWYKDEKQMAQNAQPLKNRMYDLLTPEPTRHLLNQETSSFQPADVINQNKILLVNLAGVSEQAASLIGTMIVTAVWTAAAQGRPNKPNFMYLDEFQQFSHLGTDFENMLATARKRNLGLVIATQYIERLPKSTQDAVMANARTKVIFQSSAKSAVTHAEDFASPHVRKEAFMNLKAHMALARINTDSGISPPITLQTFPEPPGHAEGPKILNYSAQTYGRDLAAITRDDETRRIVKTEASTPRKTIGRSTY